jgi:tetratricopeptide (TPR) repeat protein
LVIPLSAWESAKQSGISDALNQYQSSPTAEAAIIVHQQLLGFHQPTAAETFRKQARLKFPDDANLHVCFGADLERLGFTDQASECFQRAHELRPDLPAARLGWAGGLTRAGRLNEARALLDFLERPGATKTHPIDPLYQLALAYQGTNQHEAALELFAVIQREQPHLKENVLFRDRVQESERSITPKNESESLPHLSGRSRAGNSGKIIKIGTAVIGGALLCAMISNEFIRRQRDLYIVNTFGQAATLRISGQESRTVQGLARFSLKEGTYKAHVSGPVQEEIAFTIHDDYWHRWSGHPIWVLNLGGKTILQLTSTTYTRTNPPPPTEQI